jgi:uncharacterized protein (DUF3084 family)
MTDAERETTPETEMMEAEQRRQEVETFRRELETASARTGELEQALAERDSTIASLEEKIQDAEQRLERVNEDLSRAVAAYRELVVAANPGVLPELVRGESVDAVNESLAQAQALVSRVRQEVEAEAAQTRIPFGAPGRTSVDLSALSAREKIQYAIGGKK